MSIGIGAALREAREAQGRTLEDAALGLRARTTQLRALEEENFGAFGGDVYAKGFLKSYAVELGLDPQPLLDTYRREVGHDDVHATSLVGGVSTPTKQRVAPPAWIAWVLVVVVVFSGVFVVGLLDGGGRTPDPANPDELVGSPPSPAPSDDDEDDADADDGTDDPGDDDGAEGDGDQDDEQEPEEEADPEPDGIDLVLALEENSWMQILVDGSLALEETVQAGETLQFDGDQEIRIRFGNAGGVRVELNGEDLGSQGGRGDVVDVLFTSDGPDVL